MPEISPSKYTVHATWDDAPHLDAKTKRELWDSTPPYLRDARAKGIPSLGAGAIYPIPWDEVSCEPFPIPVHWKRGYGMDVGWNYTAAFWLAEDPVDGVLYGYAEYKARKALPLIHATAIKTRGEWITGAIDPASRGRNQKDGTRLFNDYIQQGLHLTLANNEVDAGLDFIWSLLSIGRLKLFRTLTETEKEYRMYRRERVMGKFEVETAQVVKKNDHLMDSKRYAVRTFEKIGAVRPAADRDQITDFTPSDARTNY